MYGRTIFSLLCLAFYVNCATVPNDENLNSTPAQDDSSNRASNSSDNLNEIDTSEILDICTSAICVNETINLLNYMDQAIDPCENFYDFACGKYLRETILPADKSYDLSVFQLRDKVREQIRDVLLEESPPNELHIIKLAKDFVKICMDEEKLNAAGTEPMLDYLEKYGGWPVIKGESGWNEDDWDWLKVKQQIFDDGFVNNLILEFSIGADLKNTSKRTIYVSKADDFESKNSEKFLHRPD